MVARRSSPSLGVGALAVSLVACAGPGGVGVDEPDRPNVVVMIVDDLGWQDTGLGLHPERPPHQASYRTPNLLRLADEGLTFTDAYASAPVCTPSRVSLVTGMAPARHGATYWIRDADRDTSAAFAGLLPPEWDLNGLQPGDVTLPALLSEAGYRTIHVGKAHLGARGSAGADPLNLGFDVNVAGHGLGGPASYTGLDGFGNLREGGPSDWSIPGLEPWHGEDVWLTDLLAQRAEEELRAAHAAGEPFFLHLAPYAVHAPITAHPDLVGGYADLPPTEAAYASMIESVDHMLGRVLATIDELGLADDTLFVFTSDNGGLSAHGRAGERHTHNAPLRSGKGSAYEGGTRVPLVVRWPGVVQSGTRTTEVAALHDLFPTVLAAAGVAIPADHAPRVDGVDLRGLLAGEVSALPERSILWHQPHYWGVSGPGIEPFSALRLGAEKLLWFHADGRLELYDVVADPGETHDLAALRPGRVDALANLLAARLRDADAGLSRREATGEPVRLPDRDLGFDAGREPFRGSGYDFRASEAWAALPAADRAALDQVVVDFELLWDALEDFADAHGGRPPESLDELVPRYLEALPDDPFVDGEASEAGGGYGYRTGAPGNRAWVLSSGGLSSFPFLAERNNVGLYVCKGTWISGINPTRSAD